MEVEANPISFVSSFSNPDARFVLAMMSESATQSNNNIPPKEEDSENFLKTARLISFAISTNLANMGVMPYKNRLYTL